MTRQSASQRLSAGFLVAGCRRIYGGEILSQFWDDSLGERWTPLTEHHCERWK